MSRGGAFRWPLLPRLGLLLAALTVVMTRPYPVRGQAAWEYTPYQVRVRLALQPAPQLPDSLLETLGEATSARAEAVLGAVWQVETSAAPGKLRGELLAGMENLSADSVVAAVPPADLSADKLYFAAVACNGGGLHVAVREFDCRTRQIGPLIERTSPTLSALAAALWDALAESFTPLARIERVEENHVVARLRAGGLVVDPVSRALVEPGMVLRPIVRRNDRSGQPAKGGIQPVPWSVLSVDERRDSLLECTLHSGYRTAIPVRGGVRLERLALLMRRRWPSTRLLLRARGDTDKPLVGYELHTRTTGAEATQLIGVTDADGAVELPRGEAPVQVLYVRNGKQLLARLPVAPGQEERLVASIVDDDRRLEAEGFVAALASRALDLVARREILAARFRARVKEGQLGEAQRLLDSFRKLETRAELNRDLDRYRQRVSAPDKLTQTRIDRLFNDAQKLLLLKPLSDDLLSQLTRELAAARAGGTVDKSSGGE